MAVESAVFDTAQAGASLVPAVAGKFIRVLQVAVTCWAAASVTLLSDPGGGEQTFLARNLYIGAGQPLVLRLGRPYALCTALGKGLGVAISFPSGVQPLSLTVWYDVVAG